MRRPCGSPSSVSRSALPSSPSLWSNGLSRSPLAASLSPTRKRTPPIPGGRARTMDDATLIVVVLGVMFLLLGTGVWVGLSLLGTALAAMLLFTTRPAGDAMLTTIWTVCSSWTLTALPLFIWMGEILFRTSVSEDLFRGL